MYSAVIKNNFESERVLLTNYKIHACYIDMRTAADDNTLI